MKLLFVQGGTRLKKDEKGNYYTDGNLNNYVWNRYKNYCDELLILLRSEEKTYTEEEAKKNFNELDSTNSKVIEMPDLMRPKKRFFSISWRKKVSKIIEQAVLECDKAIIRSAHNFYTLTTIKYCKKYNKPYLIEVAGYAFDGYWGHGDLYGKIVAVPYELLAKKAMREAKYCVYVTNYSLQKTYKCNGKTLGCSDVELKQRDDSILADRITKIMEKCDEKIILGTIGWVNLKVKGQHDVIKVLNSLKNIGINNFEYQLVGLGDHTYLDKLIKKYKLENNVKILGPKPHEEIFDWLKGIDIYIQPSYQEGLCRAVVEAMSMACPIIVSNAGGNPELANSKYVFKKGSKHELKRMLSNITIDELKKEAKRSFNLSKEYEKEVLDKKRDKFYKEFINS